MANTHSTLSHEHVVSRRTAIKSAASGAAAITVGAVVTSAALPAVANQTVDPILALWVERERILDESMRLCELCGDAFDALPDWARGNQFKMFIGDFERECPNGKIIAHGLNKYLTSAENVRLKLAILIPPPNPPEDEDVAVKRQCEEELAELFRYHENRWKQARAEYQRLDEQHSKILDDLSECEERITTTAATTPQGAIIKLRLLEMYIIF